MPQDPIERKPPSSPITSRKIGVLAQGTLIAAREAGVHPVETALMLAAALRQHLLDIHHTPAYPAVLAELEKQLDKVLSSAFGIKPKG
jgi:hypothetical protein